MSFLNPRGLWLGTAIILIIILYFKKEQKREIQVSNMKLWQEVFKEREGLRIRKIDNLLLLLQLMITLSIVIALAKPSLIRQKSEREITLFFDNSISMNAIEKGDSHFNIAKDKVKDYLNGLDDDVNINLVFMADKCEVAFENGSKADVLKALTAHNPSKEPLNLKELFAYKEKFQGKNVFISDKKIDFPGNMIRIDKEFKNIGITYGKYDYYTNNLIYRLKNYSSKGDEAIISFVDEAGNTVGIERVSLKPDEEIDLQFNIDKELNSIYIHIENEDMLSYDDNYFVPIGDEYKKKIALLGDNYFLETALNSIPTITYEKMDTLTEEDDYDLYIVSKSINLHSNMEGDIWYTIPQESLTAGVVEGQLSSQEKMEDVYVKETVYMKEIEKFSPVLKVEDKPVAIQGFLDNQKRAYMNIDLNKTNFPMTPYFPIYVQDTLDWFFDGEYYITSENKVNPPEDMVIGSIDNEKGENGTVREGKTAVLDLKYIFILLAIAFLIIEWKVYYYA